MDFSGDVIGSLLDLEAKEIVFSVNGKALKPFDQVSKLKSIKFPSFFSPLTCYPLSSCQIFKPLISALTGFHDRALVTRWAPLLITFSYYLPDKILFFLFFVLAAISVAHLKWAPAFMYL